MNAWRSVCGPTRLLIPALRARRRTIRGGGVAVEPVAVGVEEDRAYAAFPDREVDGSGDPGGERHGDGLAALAQHCQGAMATLETQRFDVDSDHLGRRAVR